MSTLSFLWHDYETFGLSPKRDRPAQFAALRTNADLELIDEPVNWHCQLGPDYLPDPLSCLLTGITPQHCQAVGLPENQFAAAIEAQLARPGTVGVGYNTLRFDDEFTRYLFWRNLIDPYAREWQNQCGRWDILDMVRTVYALRPETLVWPRTEDGGVSFKLELLAQANGLQHDAAHDALSDVRATLALARLIRQRQPKLFEFCFGLHKKERVLNELKWPLQRPFLHVSGRFPTSKGCLAIMWPLAPHPINRNELICWDLSHCPSALAPLSAGEVKKLLFSSSSDLPVGQDRLPIKSVHINKSPVVIGNTRVLTDELAERWGLDLSLALGEHTKEAAKLQWSDGYWAQVYQPYQSDSNGPISIEEDLYGGFASHNDRRRLNQLRAQDPAQWGTRAQAFEDERLIDLAFQYRARYCPNTLAPVEQAQWQALCKQRLTHPAAGQRGWEVYTQTLDKLQQEARQDQLEMLAALRAYVPPGMADALDGVAV